MTNQLPTAQSDESPLRAYTIDGKVTTDTTYRTRIIESVTRVEGRSFLDVGANDGVEAQALAVRGASRAVALEGKRSRWEWAVKGGEVRGLSNYEAVLGDARLVDEIGIGTFDCVCCFGFLYHMANPYNVLKRLAYVTDDLLLLETHVAPEPWTERDLLPKHRGALLRGTRTLYLDGAQFEGRICIHRGDPALTQGSLDDSWTFWLSPASLVKALTRSGFSIVEWHLELDAQTPDVIAKNGRDLRLGYANTKIFVVAKVDPARRQKIVPGTISARADAIVRPDMSESMTDRLAFQFARVQRRLGF
jgi:hypothetical protein